MRRSAALLVYRRTRDGLQVFLVHPGGPFWAKKDQGAWSIPKGEFDESEDGLAAAKREFFEEVGQTIDGDCVALIPVKQKGGKIIYTWAVEGDVDEAAVKSNEFEMEWPPRSGRKARFPEVDRGQWFSIAEARRRLLSSQVPIINELAARLGAGKH
ncbi:NUDIX domain-containing protein [Dongia deserti]|uniref:NUDIX domain-containing protein n=1 Tax=Dongia deserti TaxID=2268030 RepID=UPI000E656576|nr:NUDIX domain-containing protein [Dongia deserti]